MTLRLKQGVRSPLAVKCSLPIAAVLVLGTSGLVSGCFSATVRMWSWGEKPSTGVKVAAAAADVATAPVQIPAFAMAAITHKPYDKQAALERQDLNREAQEERMEGARLILDELKQKPSLLAKDEFWDRHPTHGNIATLGLIWFLQNPDAPASPEINAYLLRRFPNESGAILSNGRATTSNSPGLPVTSNNRMKYVKAPSTLYCAIPPSTSPTLGENSFSRSSDSRSR